jgi:hypothetical protein
LNTPKRLKKLLQKRVKRSWKILKAKLKKDKGLRKRYNAIVKMAEKRDAKEKETG